ncbi:GNAT family N-acetyltransferase [Sulfitobacter sp. 1A15299]|uniref:GNAT family N-acetyltransferase n=1 Tax=Sulfitobacter sp. 1A15299 TaxID=3368598 RepID=UPI0037472C57
MSAFAAHSLSSNAHRGIEARLACGFSELPEGQQNDERGSPLFARRGPQAGYAGVPATYANSAFLLPFSISSPGEAASHLGVEIGDIMHTAVPEPRSVPFPHLKQTLCEHYQRLSPASRELRFMGRLNDDALLRVVRGSSPDLTLGVECDDALRAILELHCIDSTHAEIGLSVEDAYQGRGYGRRLFHRGLAEARARNIETVDVNFLRSNIAIRKLCIEEGGEIRCRGAECVAQLSLN